MDRLKDVKITPLIITSDAVFRFWLVFSFCLMWYQGNWRVVVWTSV